MSHWSTHRLILLLHEYYDAYSDDIKGSRGVLDDAYFRIATFSPGNWAEPVRFLRVGIDTSFCSFSRTLLALRQL